MRASVVSGRVIDADDRPVAGASVMFTHGPVAIPDIAQITDAHGAFALAAPAEGTYRLLANAPGFPPVEQSVEVTENSKQSIKIALRRAT
jgi:hypothetical protein